MRRRSATTNTGYVCSYKYDYEFDVHVRDVFTSEDISACIFEIIGLNERQRRTGSTQRLGD